MMDGLYTERWPSNKIILISLYILKLEIDDLENSPSNIAIVSCYSYFNKFTSFSNAQLRNSSGLFG